MTVELLGTLASVIILLSLMQKNIRWLRLFNAAGCLCFFYYGVLISSRPVAGVNGLIFFINIFYLLREKFLKEKFDYLEISSLESPFLKKFMEFNRKDILKFIPGAPFPPPEDSRAFVILRNALPVSLILFREESPGRYRILMDYAVPRYRDRMNARYFFNSVAKKLRPGEFIEFYATGGSKKHRSYLKSMWFKEEGDDQYIRQG